MSRRIKKSILGFLVCIQFIGCTQHRSNYSDSQVFRYNEHSNIASLDPAFAKDISDIWAVNQLFNGLVQLDEFLNVQPDIARNWTISDDGKTYTFFLKENVKFHRHQLFGVDSTRYVTAKDFEFSFNRLLDPKTTSPGSWTLQNVKEFSAIDNHTFVIVLHKAFPPFLSLLSMKYCSVVPKEAIDYFGPDFRSNPIGTGPFRMQLWVENTKLVFRKNIDYFELDQEGHQLPYLEAVAITFLPDKQSEFLEFIQGNIDFLNSIDPAYKDDLLTSEGQLKSNYQSLIDMNIGPYLNTEYLGIYMDDSSSETQSILIRKALNYGFDRQKMIQYLRNGIGKPAIHGFIPSGLPSFNQMKGYTYQPELAKSLIAQYKKETGDTQPELTITTNSQYVDLCEYIQRELQNVGLSITVDVVPPSTLRQAKASGKLPVFRASWVADYPDAENYLSLFYSKNFVPNGPNYTHFSNKQYDSWYEASIQITTNEERYQIYQKMDSLIIENAPVVPLYYDEAVRFTRKNISGLGGNAINQLSLKHVKKE